MNLVVNEWLPEYFLRTATNSEKQQLERFLNRFWLRKDVLYVQSGSPFEAKLYRYAKENQQYPVYQNIKQFISNIILNPQRCKIINGNPELPQNIVSLLNVGNFRSDQYLFESAFYLPDNQEKIIITTDEKLQQQFQKNGFFEIVLLHDFLRDY